MGHGAADGLLRRLSRVASSHSAEVELTREHGTQLLEVVYALRSLAQGAHVGRRSRVQGAVLETRLLQGCEGAAPAPGERLPCSPREGRSPASGGIGL